MNKEAQFKEIYNQNKKKIYHLCLGYTGDTDSASDLLQETFIKVWQSLDKFRNQSQISTWIYRIAVNTCLTHLKSEKKLPKDELSPHIIDQKAEVHDEQNEQIKLLYQSISELEENERLIITLVLDEIPYHEIAEISGISEGNLRVKIHRIKQKLSEIYHKNARL